MNFTKLVEKLANLTGAPAKAQVDGAESKVDFMSNSLGDEGMQANQVRILRKGPAMRVIFFYPGEEGTYVDNAQVTLYENGIIHIASQLEETTTHLQNCEILWRFEVDGEDRVNKVRLLKPKSDRGLDLSDGSPESHDTNGPLGPNDPKPGKGPHGPHSSKSPELQ